MSSLGDQISRLSPERRALLEQKLGRQSAPQPIRRRRPDDPRVVSCAQQQLWFLDQLAPGSPAYTVPYALPVRGILDPTVLQKALDAIVGRHEILRTMYLSYQGRVLPAVAKNWSVELREVDLRSSPIADDERKIQELLEEDGARPFDLARDLKLRAAIYRLTDDQSIFLHVSHHIAWDLHSRTIFYRELEQLYDGFRSGREVTLPEMTAQYADYALWQRQQLQGETLERLETYWREQLAGAPAALDLPTDFPRPAFQHLRGTRLPLQLGADILEAARALARDSKVTLYMTFLASFYVFLYCYSGQDDFSVGSPFDERKLAQMEPMIGMFINTLVLRVRLDRGMTFRDLLGRVRDVVLGAIAHQDLPFDKIVDAVQPARDLSRMALFQSNFRLQGAAAPPLRLSGVEIGPSSVVDNATAKFDIALELPSTPNGWGYLEYSTTLFQPSTAQRMADGFQLLIRGLLEQPELSIDRLDSVRMIVSGAGSC
ncbi:hypothetical protein CCAX7_24920 [Capsulimonas corticalis]|uniref:Uncharacterized protein n=1 Tax=Capsulimonas corticalis TaxID=2219043 RepID=A0A402CVM0_9BACT|nr:condensation domain-containing protein [Capsulimonas corticalis]BDI30441.1 hypothetical protein CCAX7_24920 [Capsulimonas corticalis]